MVRKIGEHEVGKVKDPEEKVDLLLKGCGRICQGEGEVNCMGKHAGEDVTIEHGGRGPDCEGHGVGTEG